LDNFPENEVSLHAIKRLANQDHREKRY
jgi:hypothetical protein